MKTEEKENALFSVRWEESPPAEDFEPDIFGILRWTVDCETLHLFVYLKDTKHACARPLQGKLLRPERPGDCLGLLHLRVNLRLSYRTASKYKMVCLGQVMFLLEFGLVMYTYTIDIS